MEQPVELVCATCTKIFSRAAKEHRRQTKIGNTEFYCSLSCVCVKKNENNPPIWAIKNLKQGNDVSDQYSPFRYMLCRIKQRSKTKGRDYDITVEYLKELWDQQNGICDLSGQKLLLPVNTGKSWKNRNPFNASIDRIDNSKGYVKGNVRFTSFMGNIARCDFTDEQLIDFCKCVVEHNSK